MEQDHILNNWAGADDPGEACFFLQKKGIDSSHQNDADPDQTEWGEPTLGCFRQIKGNLGQQH